MNQRRNPRQGGSRHGVLLEECSGLPDIDNPCIRVSIYIQIFFSDKKLRQFMRSLGGSKLNEVLALARRSGIIRPRDVASLGLPREYLGRLASRGLLERAGRGLYVIPELAVDAQASLIEACKRVPHGVLCLLSALRFHNLTTQAPFEVWIAIDRIAYAPRTGSPALRLFRFSGDALTAGIEEHLIEGATIRVYSPAKTVADCFKYRNKIGTDVALEALREFRREHRGKMDELWHYAKICRVANVMRPYLEAM